MSDSLRRRVYWLPLILFVCLFLLFVIAGSYLHVEDRKVRVQKAQSVAAQTKAYMETFSVERKQALDNLMKSWPSNQPNIEDWFNAQAQLLTSMQKGYSSLVHGNQNQRISWVFTPLNQFAHSRLSNQLIGQPLSSTGIDLLADSDTVQHIILRDSKIDDSPYYLVIGRAISPQEIEHGYLVASYNLSNILYALLGDIVASADVDTENQFDIELTDGDTVLLSSGAMDRRDTSIITEPVEFIYRDWQLSIRTRAKNAYLGVFVAAVGGIMSLLISLFLHKQLKSGEALHRSQSRFRTASDAALDALMIYTPKQQGFELIEVNQYARVLFDEKILANDRVMLKDQLALLQQEKLHDLVAQVHQSGLPKEDYIEVHTDLIHASWIKVQIVRAGDDIALTIRDVSARFSAQLALEESREKYRRLIDGLHRHFVYIKNTNHDFDYVSAGVEDIFGLPVGEFCSYEPAMQHVLSSDAENQRAIVANGGKPKPYIIEYLAKEAGTYVIEYTDTCVFNSDGQLVAIEGIARDVTQERELQRKVVFQASHDQLTGLYNRYAFDGKLKQLLLDINQSDETAVMCFIDMDRFKLVNDTCGHPAGDRLLKEVAQLFSQHVGSEDTLARIGGDEFCMIFRHTSLAAVKTTLDELLHEISAYRFVYEDQIFFVGASIGVIEINQHLNDAAELIKAADNACYQAKYLGRNRYHIYESTASQIEVSQTESAALSWLQKAISTAGFELHCQKIQSFSQQSDRYQYEILIRMRNPANELVSPGLFIPLAERHGLMNKVDWWVVDNTLAMLESEPEHVARLEKVAINLSGLTLGDTGMLERIMKRVAVSSIQPSKLCFEITETEAVTNLTSAKHFIESLRDVGCRFALDDFGAGMSSFTYLKHLDVDYVKIDGSFVRNMTNDPIDVATVKAINSIAHSMGKETVAEFVINDETAQMLTKLNVDYGQGFGLGKPVPLADVIDNIANLSLT